MCHSPFSSSSFFFSLSEGLSLPKRLLPLKSNKEAPVHPLTTCELELKSNVWAVISHSQTNWTLTWDRLIGKSKKTKQINPCWILIFCPCFCIFTWLYLINVMNMCCRGLNDPFPAPRCLYSLSRSTVSGLPYLSSRRYSQGKFCILNTFFLFTHRKSPKAKPRSNTVCTVQW